MAGTSSPELTGETIVDGLAAHWRLAFRLLRPSSSFGRKRNMIVTEEGKNIYPKTLSKPSKAARQGFASSPPLHLAATFHGQRKLLLVIHLEHGQAFTPELKSEIPAELPPHQLQGGPRHGDLSGDFPLTASLKIKRSELAQRLAA